MPASLRWLCAILITALAWNAAAQNYPSQPIRLIAPFPPTLQEAGLKDSQFTQWQALLAPSKETKGITAD